MMISSLSNRPLRQRREKIVRKHLEYETEKSLTGDNLIIDTFLYSVMLQRIFAFHHFIAKDQSAAFLESRLQSTSEFLLEILDARSLIQDERHGLSVRLSDDCKTDLLRGSDDDGIGIVGHDRCCLLC
jgi:hypothetical protein